MKAKKNPLDKIKSYAILRLIFFFKGGSNMPNSSYSYQQKETKKFWDIISSKTDNLVHLSYVVHEPKNRNRIQQLIELNDGDPISPNNVAWLLYAENAWYENKKHKKSVVWKFTEGLPCNIVIVDNINYLGVELTIRLDAFLLCRTGRGKYQAAFLLDKYVDEETAKKIQRFFATIYKADKESIGKMEGFKIPGFYNTEYIDDPPYIELVYTDERNVLSVEHILYHYKLDIESRER